MTSDRRIMKHIQSNRYDSYSAHPPARSSVSTSVVLYQQETVPLLPRRTKRNRLSLSHLCLGMGSFMTFALLVTFFCFTLIHFMLCPLDPSTRDAIRRDWDTQVAQHADVEHTWQRRTEEHAEIEQGWKCAAEQHARDVAQRIHEEHERQARVREEWMHEAERHTCAFEEMKRREWEERERERQRWQQETEERERREEQARRGWEQELEERERREEEERQRRHMYWGHVQPHTCTTYATREYTAQLMNLPTSWKHRVDACKATPLEVHGISHLPDTCEDKGPGVVMGRWEINQQEPDCTTFWDSYNDKGCTSPGSGRKYITHKLQNLPEGGDWKEFCATTPIHFDNLEFPSAKECFKSVWGVFGQWEVDDDKC